MSAMGAIRDRDFSKSQRTIARLGGGRIVPARRRTGLFSGAACAKVRFCIRRILQPKQRRLEMAKKGYLVSAYRSIKDPDKLAAYAKLAGPAFSKYGAKYLARGDAAQAYEAGIKQRIVIVEFESVAKAVEAHDSADYQAALKVLDNGVERDLRIVEGLE
jgi:uncharacterized protein (DUF1330 family)